jgi:hypothetical protein
MLGIVSLGSMIRDARVVLAYDEVFGLILVGGAMVVLGDLVSLGGRHLARG